MDNLYVRIFDYVVSELKKWASVNINDICKNLSLYDKNHFFQKNIVISRIKKINEIECVFYIRHGYVRFIDKNYSDTLRDKILQLEDPKRGRKKVEAQDLEIQEKVLFPISYKSDIRVKQYGNKYGLVSGEKEIVPIKYSLFDILKNNDMLIKTTLLKNLCDGGK